MRDFITIKTDVDLSYEQIRRELRKIDPRIIIVGGDRVKQAQDYLCMHRNNRGIPHISTEIFEFDTGDIGDGRILNQPFDSFINHSLVHYEQYDRGGVKFIKDANILIKALQDAVALTEKNLT